MRRSLYFVAVTAIALMLHSCTTMYNSSSYGYGDLYTTNNRAEVANQLKAKAEIERAEAEARQAQWQAMQAEAAADRAEAEYYASLNSEPSFSSVLATDYESAYARRLYGFQSPTYRLPASYYDLMTSSAYFYATAYDPAFYNVMVSGNQVWVEPKYVTSMFGTWGATNITFGIYASPWNFGWRYVVDPFYYSWWGYPRYSWYDWNWNLCYNPFHYDWYYWGYDPYHHHHHPHYGPGHGPGHGPGPRPPQHRPEHGYTPGHVTGPGASGGHPGHNLNGNRPSSGTRYTSPTTNRSYGSSGHSGGRPAYSGTISTGIYTGKDSKNSTNTTYRGGSTNLNVTTRNNANQSLNISSGGSSNRGNNNASTTTTKRGDNYRQSNSTTSRSSGTNSSNNSYNSSSNYRSGNSTSSSRSSSSNYNRYDTDRGYNSTSNYRSNNNSSTSRSTGGYGSGSTSRSSSGGARSGGSTSSRR